ncbi:MAG: GAF domain-containing protein [Ramlibacter sp.]
MTTPAPKVNVGKLLAIENEIAAATASYSTAAALEPLSRFLEQVRDALGMDVAFISQFVGERRHVETVTVAGDAQPNITKGSSDSLVDTYCKLVADGELPAVINDVADNPRAAALPITGALNIKSFLSARVVLRDGTVFGTVCCFSHQPRPDLVEADAKALRGIAEAIAACVQRDGTVQGPVWR